MCSVLPFEVNSGDVEDDSFKPQDHKESLGEWTVTNAFTVTSRLHTHMHTRKHIMRHTHTSAKMRASDQLQSLSANRVLQNKYKITKPFAKTKDVLIYLWDLLYTPITDPKTTKI